MHLLNMVHAYYAHNNVKLVELMEHALNAPNPSIIHNPVKNQKIQVNVSNDQFQIVQNKTQKIIHNVHNVMIFLN